jgi:hypothetical protein
LIRVIDLDLEEKQKAAECREIIANVAGRSAPSRVGRWSRVALFFRSDDPDRPSRRCRLSGGGIHFLGKGAQAIVDGIHPGTLKPYYWVDDPVRMGSGRSTFHSDSAEAAIVDRKHLARKWRLIAARPFTARLRAAPFRLAGVTRSFLGRSWMRHFRAHP